jgi:EH domain-containing protein 1
MNRLQCSHLNSPILNGLSLIDTPGILSGEKQSTDRGYDYSAVLSKKIY